MSNVAKFLIILNLILAGAFLGVASNFLGQKDHVEQKLQSMVATGRAELVALQDEHKRDKDSLLKVSAENSTLKASNQALEARAQAIAQENQNLVDQLKTIGGAHTHALAALEAQNAVIESNNTLIKQLQDERGTLVSSRDSEKDARVKAEAVQAQLQRQLDDEVSGRKAGEASLGEANRKIAELDAVVQGYTEKYGGNVAVQPAVGPGKVLAVDNAAGLVVISLGAEDGLKNGYEYIVSRGNQYVATVKVIDAQAKKSTGLVVSGMQKQPVSAGDTVSNR
jgi:hypothetical protein